MQAEFARKMVGMTLAFDLPEIQPSLVQQLDPRWKLAGVLLAGAALAIVQTWEAAFIGCAGAILLAFVARLPCRWTVRRLGTASVLFVLFFVWLPFVGPFGVEDPVREFGPITISLTGLERLGALTGKFIGMVSLILVLLATAPLQDTFKAAHALYIPGWLVQLVLLAYRYVYLLGDEFARLRTALRARCFRARTNLHTYRTIGAVSGTLLVRSAERSERVAQAMRCRGFDGNFRTAHEFKTCTRDVLVFTLMVGYAALLLAVDWLAR